MAGPSPQRVGSEDFLRQFDRPGAIIANVVAHIIAAVPSTLYVTPASVFISTYNVGPADIAILMSVGMAMTSLTALIIGFNVYRLNMRHAVMVGMALHIIGSAISLFGGSWNAILVGRVLSAIGDGVVLSASNAVLGRSKQNTRNWGISGVVSGLSTAAASYALGQTLGEYGPSALFLGLLLAGVVAAPLMMLIPAYTLPPELRVPPKVGGLKRISTAFGSFAGVMLLIGGGFVALGDSAIWFFNGIIGEQAGQPIETIGSVQSAAYFAATLGALGVAIVGHRFGRAKPLILLGALCAIGAVGLGMSTSFWPYALSSVLMMGTFRAIIPFLYATCARQDQSGGINAMFSVTVGLGGVIGPQLTVLLLGGGSSYIIPGIVGGLILMTGCLIHAFYSFGHERSDRADAMAAGSGAAPATGSAP